MRTGEEQPSSHQGAAEAIVTPKRPFKTPGTAKSSWFSYYAGYSDDFVSGVLRRLSLRNGATILDPWNGAGTTTQVADERGLNCQGFDINPAMVTVAKARLLHHSIKPSHVSLAAQLVATSRRDEEAAKDEPLERWFAPSSARIIRSLERAIATLLVDGGCETRVANVNEMSALAAFFYVALFRTTRSFLRPFLGSNPTWIRPPPSRANRVRPPSKLVASSFREHVRRMGAAISRRDASSHAVSVGLANCTSLPIEDGSIDLVVTSPPYCTRIDYAVATSPELAVLGLDAESIHELRQASIGSVLTSGSKPKPTLAWGPTCLRLLSAIRRHPSRASKNYYHNSHLIYFGKMFQSIGELSRTLKSGGEAVLVVQDSYYKEIHNDLQTIITQMASAQNLELFDQQDFELHSTKASMNPRRLKYRTSASATESVLWLKKH